MRLLLTSAGVNNPSAGNQYLTSVTVKVANADGSPWTSGTCNKDDFSVGGAPVDSPCPAGTAAGTPGLTCANHLPRSAASFLKSGESSNSLRATARRRSTVAASSVSAVGMFWKVLRSLSSAMACSETSMK